MTKSTGKKTGQGLMIASALAAAIGGAYLLVKKKKEIKAAGAWVLRAKADVMDEVHKIPGITKKSYEEIVSRVVESYSKLKEVSKSEAASLKKELKEQWQQVTKKMKK